MNIAFAGLRHSHIFVLYNMAKSNPNYNIIGAFEDDQQAKIQAEQNGVLINYSSYDALLSDKNCDVVALGGCFGDRGKMAILALKAGKHVIADKPLCTSLSELDEIELLAKENNLLVSCMLTMRFEKKINAVKRLFESGALGEINNVYFGGQHPLQYGRRPDWYFKKEMHGGTINDIAIHGIDAINYMFGLDVDEILAARCWNKFAKNEPDFKDSAQFMITAQNGTGILADVSYSIPDGVEFDLPYYWQFYIWATRGTLRFSLGEENSYYYLSGEKNKFLLEESPLKIDYLTDFYISVSKDKKTVLSMDEVLSATRTTLQIQQRADSE